MKRAFSTVACMGYSYKEIADCAVWANMDAVEIRLNDDGSICGLSEDELSEASTYFKAKNLVICDLGTSVNLVDYSKEQIEKAKGAVLLANQVGAKGIRVFLAPFVKYHTDLQVYDFEGIVKALKELCVYAEEFGVEIWVETHNAFSTGACLKELLDAVACDNLKIIWDIIHPIEKGEMPEETMAYLGNRIAHVHIKDGKPFSDSNRINYVYTKLGEGTLPIKKIITMAMEKGYNGYFSLEWEKEWKVEIRDTFENLTDILEQYNHFLDSLQSEVRDGE